MVWYAMVLVWYGMVWYCVAWCGMAWHRMVCMYCYKFVYTYKYATAWPTTYMTVHTRYG